MAKKSSSKQVGTGKQGKASTANKPAKAPAAKRGEMEKKSSARDAHDEVDHDEQDQSGDVMGESGNLTTHATSINKPTSLQGYTQI